jgi:hypothetical protein
MKERMKRAVIFDGRNIYDRAELISAGFDHIAIGK